MNCLSRVSGDSLPAPGASRGLGVRAGTERRKARKLLISADLSRLRRSCGALIPAPPAKAGGWQTVAAYAAKTIHSHVLLGEAKSLARNILDSSDPSGRGGRAMLSVGT